MTATEPEPEALVRVQGLQKRYRRGAEVVHAVAGVDLRVHPGELVALAGPSGSGKTTLLNVLMGWEAADAGEVTWGGAADPGGSGSVPALAALADRSPGWSEVAVLPQRLGLVAELSVRENVALPLRLSGTLDHAAVEALLSELGLADVADRPPEEASLGEQQRAALARALVRSPRLLLADEPTGHQDEGWTIGIRMALRRRCDAGMGAIVATHEEVLLDAADRVVELRDGVVANA